MAQPSLAAHHSSDFHTVLTESIRQFREQVCAVVDRAMEPELADTFCSYEYPESFAGQCDGQPCSELATVSELSGDHAFCAKHFREVTR
jgi:hypothetical protein